MHVQVKSVEEQYSSHMRQLEVQLEEALQQQQQAEAAAAAAEAAAAEAAAVAAAAAAAGDSSGLNACYLPAIDTSSAAEKTLQLLDKLLLVRLVAAAHVMQCLCVSLRARVSYLVTALNVSCMNYRQLMEEAGNSRMQMLAKSEIRVTAVTIEVLMLHTPAAL